jgi:hypothetical protein
MTQSSMSNLLRSRGRQLSSRCMQSTACAGCCREAVKRCGLTHPGAAKAASESCRSEVPWPVCDGMVAVAWARAVRTGWCGMGETRLAAQYTGPAQRPAVSAVTARTGRVRSCTRSTEPNRCRLLLEKFINTIRRSCHVSYMRFIIPVPLCIMAVVRVRERARTKSECSGCSFSDSVLVGM